MASPGHREVDDYDVLKELLEGYEHFLSDHDSFQEAGTSVTSEISAREPTRWTSEAAAADPGKNPEDENSGNILSGLESGSVSSPPQGPGLLIPTAATRGSRRKSKPKKLIVPEEEDVGSPLDAAKDEEFIKKETEDTDTGKNSTEPHGDPPPRTDPPPAEVIHRCGMRIDSRQSMRSELWIAQDGTTSSRFIPQDLRPPGWTHKTYSRKPLLLQCPISLSSDVAPNSSGSDQTGSKRAPPGRERCCDQCNEQFADTSQLAAHQKLHTKKPRR